MPDKSTKTPFQLTFYPNSPKLLNINLLAAYARRLFAQSELAAFLTISEQLSKRGAVKDESGREWTDLDASGQDGTQEDIATRPRTLADVIDYEPSSKIDEYIQSKLICFLQYMEEKAKETQTGEATHGANAENALKQMLYYDVQIGELMLRAADREEAALIREAYGRLAGL